MGGSRAFVGVVSVLVFSLIVAQPQAGAEEGWIRSVGGSLGGGASTRTQAVILPLELDLGLRLPELLDRPLVDASLRVEWIIKAWVAPIVGQQNTAEVGLNPIGLRVALDAGQKWVPFAGFGLGILATGLRDVRTGGGFQFNESFGLGLAWFWTPKSALSVSYRYRHVSNAGIYDRNGGLDTQYALLGIHWFPERVAK